MRTFFKKIPPEFHFSKSVQMFKLFILIAIPAMNVSASPISSVGDTPVIVGNDRGGSLEKKVREIVILSRSKRDVRVTGEICYSTCTLYLGLPNVCISPRTVFGFHGPTSYGRTLDPNVFEAASKLISRYYPPALKTWYMEEGRFRLRGLYKITGEKIISLGVTECQEISQQYHKSRIDASWKHADAK